MSYRTKINDVQLFGNNEFYEKWGNFIESQGIEIDEDGLYEGEIKDVMGAISVLEEIVSDIEKEPHRDISLFDLTQIREKISSQKSRAKLLDQLISITENGYLFLPYTFIKACGDCVEEDKHYADKKHFNCFKIKEGKSVKTKAS